MKKSWMKKPFPLDPVPDTVIFHAHAHPKRRKGRKVIVPTFTLKSPIQPETVYQLDLLIHQLNLPRNLQEDQFVTRISWELLRIDGCTS